MTRQGGHDWAGAQQPAHSRVPSVRAPRTAPPAEIGKPRPGHGTVYVMPDPSGQWWGSWQDEYPHEESGQSIIGCEDMFGDESTVMRWARTRPTQQRLIFSPTVGEYLPMPDLGQG